MQLVEGDRWHLEQLPALLLPPVGQTESLMVRDERRMPDAHGRVGPACNCVRNPHGSPETHCQCMCFWERPSPALQLC